VLGASTIVGSAAFNLLVISGLSIYAVGDEENDYETKKVKNTGVFAITSTISLFAYIWLYMLLELVTPELVTPAEAWLTLIYFVLLILFAYAADIVQKHFREQAQSEQDVIEKNAEDERKIKKNELRQIAKSIQGDSAFSLVVQIAQGVQTEETRQIDQPTQNNIIMLYK
jgi:Ca2+/Na+ antiporter